MHEPKAVRKGHSRSADQQRLGAAHVMSMVSLTMALMATAAGAANPSQDRLEAPAAEGAGMVLCLSADRTTLTQGEPLEVTLQVTGLRGLTESLPLTLSNQTPDILTVEGGATQQIVIRPEDVNASGAYSRVIRAQAAGAGDFTLGIAQSGQGGNVNLIAQTQPPDQPGAIGIQLPQPPHAPQVTFPPLHYKGQTWPMHLTGATWPVHSAGVSYAPHAKNVTFPPLHFQGQTWPTHLQGVTWPVHALGVSYPPHVKNVTFPPQHYKGQTWPNHLTGVTWPYHSLGVSYSPHAKGVTFPPQHFAGQTWPTHLQGVTWPIHVRGVSYSPHRRNITFPPYHNRGQTWPLHRVQMSWPPPNR